MGIRGDPGDKGQDSTLYKIYENCRMGLVDDMYRHKGDMAKMEAEQKQVLGNPMEAVSYTPTELHAAVDYCARRIRCVISDRWSCSPLVGRDISPY